MASFLEKIENPEDLKLLSTEQLKILAGEIRDYILGSVSQTGGHLASSLGVVELTIALHYVFDFKNDKLIWDVGHQCYAHKILTSRKDKFSRLRLEDGISGFPSPEESEYDQFTVGHAGTSIATSIGMALGEDYQESSDKIVAFVGDASIVNGTNFEGLNNLGLVKRQLLIVLNDNSMAIDETVGAVAKYFSQVRLSQRYEDLRKTTRNILEHMPVIGKSVEDAIERFKKSIRMVLPASQLFESLNIPYFGPVDGHSIPSLVKLFKALGHLNRPAILHIYTKKGKGFSPAEQDRPRFHSTGPFEMNGDAVAKASGRKTFTSVFGEHLSKLAEDDKRIVAITSAMTEGTGLGQFKSKFPERFYDFGIAEGAAVDIAAGLAKMGSKPVVCIYSTFLQRSFDQIFQEVALQNLGVVFCIDHAGFVGADGPTHHGLMDVGFLRMLPNMVLTAPANEVEVKLALEFAIAEDKPVCIRYPKDFIPAESAAISGCQKRFELGRSITLRSSADSKAAIVSYGSLLGEALGAAEVLCEEGIEVDVINARFASPVDEKIIGLIREGKSIITIEDHYLSCGFGSAVLESASSALGGRIDKPIITLGAPSEFIKHNTRGAQLMEAGLNVDKIVSVVREAVSGQ